MSVDRKNAVCDQSISSTTALKHRRSSKVPQTGGPKSRSSSEDIHAMKSLDNRGSQVPAGGLQTKALASKYRYIQDNSEIFTTDKLYYSSATHSASEHDLMEGTEVLGKWLTEHAMLFYYFNFGPKN